MKTAASLNNSILFNSTLPMTSVWGVSSQRLRRPQPRVQRLPGLTTEEFAASQQEIICGGILGLCFLYTLAVCFTQLA